MDAREITHFDVDDRAWLALNPATRHSLHGMLFGRVRRAWAREHHPKWVAALEEEKSGRPPHAR
jgi:cytochrome b subunit of formate dehydrogenase